MEGSPITGQNFFLNKNHPKNYKRVQTVYKVSKQEEVEKSEKLDFPLEYQKIKDKEQYEER